MHISHMSVYEFSGHSESGPFCHNLPRLSLRNLCMISRNFEGETVGGLSSPRTLKSHPGLKSQATPAHTKHLGWRVELEFRGGRRELRRRLLRRQQLLAEPGPAPKNPFRRISISLKLADFRNTSSSENMAVILYNMPRFASRKPLEGKNRPVKWTPYRRMSFGTSLAVPSRQESKEVPSRLL